MTLEKHESEAALNFYVAFGNLQRDPDSPTLIKQYDKAQAELIRRWRINGHIPPPLIGATIQDIVDLQHLLSIAIWIRSDQLNHPETLRRVEADDLKSLPAPVEIDTHCLHIANCGGDLEHALEWWKRFAQILDKHAANDRRFSWEKK